jgi:hypothetical protein
LPISKWIEKYRRKPYEITILEECSSKLELDEAEIFYIAYFRAIGAKLLNCTAGGEGSVGCRRPKPESRSLKEHQVAEVRHLLSLGKFRQVEIGEMFGVSQAVISLIKLGKQWTEYNVNKNLPYIRAPATKAARENFSRSHRGYCHSAETRALQSSQRKGEGAGMAKLTWIQVVEIRSLLTQGRSIRSIAPLFQVCEATIGHIKMGRTWKV